MFSKEQNTLESIAAELSREPAVRSIIAYGSRVRGDFREDSDFDVFVLVDKKSVALKSRIIDVFYSHELASGIPFSVAIFSREEFDFNAALGSHFIKSMQTEGIVIYDAHRGREKVPFNIPA